MSETPRRLADHLSPSVLVVGAVSVIVTVLVIALGFDFDPNEFWDAIFQGDWDRAWGEVEEALEVLVTGVLLVGVMGVAAGIAWAVGHVVDLLTEDASP